MRKLVEALDRATQVSCPHELCTGVKEALTEGVTADGRLLLDPGFLLPSADNYARRLLHRDPEGRYSAVVMVWGIGQGTPIHDHAGNWCVECVYRGRIRVTSYRPLGDPLADRVGFAMENQIVAGFGDAGALIPPYEYHTIENAGDELAATIHVYKNEMTRCNVYHPTGNGLYRREEKELVYTEAGQSP